MLERRQPDDPWEREWVPERRQPDYEDERRRYRVVFNLEKNFDGKDLNILRDAGYPRPNNFYDTNIQDLNRKSE